MEEETSLDRLPPDRRAVVQEVFAQGAQRRRLQELGLFQAPRWNVWGPALGGPQGLSAAGDGNCPTPAGRPSGAGGVPFQYRNLGV